MRAHNINCVWGSSSSAVYMYSLGYFSHIEFKSDLNQIKSRLIRIIARCKSFPFFFLLLFKILTVRGISPNLQAVLVQSKNGAEEDQLTV